MQEDLDPDPCILIKRLQPFGGPETRQTRLAKFPAFFTQNGPASILPIQGIDRGGPDTLQFCSCQIQILKTLVELFRINPSQISGCAAFKALVSKVLRS